MSPYPQPFDYYIYATQWPSARCKQINATGHWGTTRGYCNFVPNRVNASAWAVHGLWPKHHDRRLFPTYPLNCNISGREFDKSKLYSIIDELHSYWPDLFQNHILGGPGHPHLWQWEWEKHGSCDYQNNTDSTVLNYFKTCMYIRQSLDFDSKLSSANIVPSLSTAYRLIDIQRVLGTGHYDCYTTSRRATLQVLVQVLPCLDKDFKQVDCNLRGWKLRKTLEILFFSKALDFPALSFNQLYKRRKGSPGYYRPGSCSNEMPVLILPADIPMDIDI